MRGPVAQSGQSRAAQLVLEVPKIALELMDELRRRAGVDALKRVLVVEGLDGATMMCDRSPYFQDAETPCRGICLISHGRNGVIAWDYSSVFNVRHRRNVKFSHWRTTLRRSGLDTVFLRLGSHLLPDSPTPAAVRRIPALCTLFCGVHLVFLL